MEAKPYRWHQKEKERKECLQADDLLLLSKLGHWNRNCKVYLAGVKLGALDASKGMYEIHTILDSSTSYTWVLDTACGHHICKSLQGNRGLE